MEHRVSDNAVGMEHTIPHKEETSTEEVYGRSRADYVIGEGF
jgi:hypothetical protein